MTARNDPASPCVMSKQKTEGSQKVNRIMLSAAGAAVFIAGAITVPADAKGCLKGAAVGGIGGHMAGHGMAGAAGGCAVGHHMAHKKEKRESNKSG